MKLLWAVLYKSLGGHPFSFLLGVYRGMTLLGRKAGVGLILSEAAKQVSKAAVPFEQSSINCLAHTRAHTVQLGWQMIKQSRCTMWSTQHEAKAPESEHSALVRRSNAEVGSPGVEPGPSSHSCGVWEECPGFLVCRSGTIIVFSL